MASPNVRHFNLSDPLPWHFQTFVHHLYALLLTIGIPDLLVYPLYKFSIGTRYFHCAHKTLLFVRTMSDPEQWALSPREVIEMFFALPFETELLPRASPAIGSSEPELPVPPLANANQESDRNGNDDEEDGEFQNAGTPVDLNDDTNAIASCGEAFGFETFQAELAASDIAHVSDNFHDLREAWIMLSTGIPNRTVPLLGRPRDFWDCQLDELVCSREFCQWIATETIAQLMWYTQTSALAKTNLHNFWMLNFCDRQARGWLEWCQLFAWSNDLRGGPAEVCAAHGQGFWNARPDTGPLYANLPTEEAKRQRDNNNRAVHRKPADEVPHYGPVYTWRGGVVYRQEGPYFCCLCYERFISPDHVKMHFFGSQRRFGNTGKGCKYYRARHLDIAWDSHPSCAAHSQTLLIQHCTDGWVLLDQASFDRLNAANQYGRDTIRAMQFFARARQTVGLPPRTPSPPLMT